MITSSHLHHILSGKPMYVKTHIALTLTFFIVWCTVGYLLPEKEWDRSKTGIWGGYKGKSSYCEEIRHAASKKKMASNTTFSNTTSAFMAQPVNSLSNYTFVAYGFIVLSLFWSDLVAASSSYCITTATTATAATATTATSNPLLRNTLQSHPLWSLIMSLSMMMIGTTSFLFHASLTPISQILDVAAIYQGLGLMLLCNIARFFQPIPLYEATRHSLLRVSPKCSVSRSPGAPCCTRKMQKSVNNILMVLGVFVCCPLFYIFKKKLNSTIMFAMLVVGNLFVLAIHCWLYRPSLKWSCFGVTGVTLLVAVLFRQSEVDEWGIECNPTGAWQGHSAWHFFTATSLFFGYLMFRSETYLVDVGADDQIEKVGKEGKEGKETKDYDMESIPSRGTNSMQIIEVVEMVED